MAKTARAATPAPPPPRFRDRVLRGGFAYPTNDQPAFEPQVGEIREDVPLVSRPWLIERGYIEPVTDEAPPTPQEDTDA